MEESGVNTRILEEVRHMDNDARWVPTNFLEGESGIFGYTSRMAKGIYRYLFPKENPAEPIKDDQIKRVLQEKLRTKGPLETVAYVKTQMTAWKTEPVKFAVIGRSGIGKSTFINMVRNCEFGDDGEAEVGLQDTTTVVKEYIHPKNKQIIYCDSPGFSLSLSKKEILERLNLPQFDYFLVFFDLLRSEDEDFVKEIQKCGTPFCLVRNRIDIEVQSEKARNNKGESRTISELRDKIESSTKGRDCFKDAALFFISCVDPSIGEFNKLDAHMKKSLSSAKYEAVMLCLPVLTQQVIETKYKQLKSRIPLVSIAAGLIAAVPVPLLDLKINYELIKLEIEHYISTFGLQTENTKDVPGLTCKVYSIGAGQFLQSLLTSSANISVVAAITQLDTVIPFVGSGLSFIIGKLFVRYVLLKTLEEMKSDAYIVFKHHFKQNESP